MIDFVHRLKRTLFQKSFLLFLVFGLFILGIVLTRLVSQTERSSSIESTTQPAPRIIQPETSPEPSTLNVPRSKLLASGTHTFQTFNNCGPAALSMALSHYGITESQQVLGAALRPYQQSQGNNDDKSVTLREVAAKGKEYGFISYHRPAGTTEIIEAFIAQDIPVIARTLLTPTEDIGHYRVIKGYDQDLNLLIQDDSLQGKDLSYSYQEFETLWKAFNYEFVVLVPPEKQAVAEDILDNLLNENRAWEIALQLAMQDAEKNPSDVYPLFNQSVALYHLGRYQESTAIYEQVANQLPFRTLWYQLEPVLSYYELEDYDQVLAIADDILNNQNRAYSELHQLKGLIYRERSQSEAAMASFAEAQRFNTSEYWKLNLP